MLRDLFKTESKMTLNSLSIDLQIRILFNQHCVFEDKIPMLQISIVKF